MTRYGAMAIFAVGIIATGLTRAGSEKEFRVQGKLTKDDGKDAQRGGASQSHTVPLKAGKAYTIDMVSTDFDSYLRLLDPKGNQLAQDDDSGGGLNARIIFNCAKDGDYKIACTSFGADAFGSYTLTVKTSAGVQRPNSTHAMLIGNSAPPFRGDFAVNGKAGALADLKGKIVLLDFFDVRSSQSTALLLHLKKWHHSYKDKGLAIVGITFYTSDIKQALAFDPASGKIVTVPEADRKSDRALLAAYTAYHKIEHVLMTLPQKSALEAYDAYAVNGVPLMVLIDRKGRVRAIDVGGEKNVPLVESEIQKLLAEK